MEVSLSRHAALYLDGAWPGPISDSVISVENPATEGEIAKIPDSTAADVDRAVQAARQAFPVWAATSRAERAEHLRRLKDLLAMRGDEIATTIATDVGTPLRIASRIQAALPVTDVGTYVDLLNEDEPEERIGNSLVVREPAGVVAAITPWNYPLHQVGREMGRHGLDEFTEVKSIQL